MIQFSSRQTVYQKTYYGSTNYTIQIDNWYYIENESNKNNSSIVTDILISINNLSTSEIRYTGKIYEKTNVLVYLKKNNIVNFICRDVSLECNCYAQICY